MRKGRGGRNLVGDLDGGFVTHPADEVKGHRDGGLFFDKPTESRELVLFTRRLCDLYLARYKREITPAVKLLFDQNLSFKLCQRLAGIPACDTKTGSQEIRNCIPETGTPEACVPVSG